MSTCLLVFTDAGGAVHSNHHHSGLGLAVTGSLVLEMNLCVSGLGPKAASAGSFHTQPPQGGSIVLSVTGLTAQQFAAACTAAD